ncbi:glycosyltransferase, partial [Bifidobacterium longum]
MSKILKSMNLRITVITVCRNSVDTIERTFTS